LAGPIAYGRDSTSDRRTEVLVDVKKVLLLVAAAVLIYTLIAHPTQLGDGVQAIFGWITDGIAAIGDFLKSIVN
jgi:hypothetical protein